MPCFRVFFDLFFTTTIYRNFLFSNDLVGQLAGELMFFNDSETDLFQIELVYYVCLFEALSVMVEH